MAGFFHAQVALGTVVGKRYFLKDREGQHIEVEGFQPVEEIGGFALGPARRGGDGGVGPGGEWRDTGRERA